MNKLTKTIAAIIAVCLLSVSGVAFASSGCSGLQVRTVQEVIGSLDEGETWQSKLIAHLENISCSQIYFHYARATTSSAPNCAEPTRCTLSTALDDESGGGDTIDCVFFTGGGIASCN
ncbi:MAG: hypothetical protein ACO3KY_09785 [Lysobacterales bacterium]